MSAFLRGEFLKLDVCLPAAIVSYDRGQNLATVQPLINWVLTDDSQRSRHQIIEVPCLSLGGGGFHVNFPLKQGDIGWIIAADRDLSLFKQTLQAAQPPLSRLHSFSDSMFIPDVFRQYTVASEDANAMVIQSTDGNTKISIRGDNILIAAPTKVVVRVPLTEFTQDVQVDGKLTVTGQSTLNGGVNANGSTTVTLPSSTTINGKQVDGHRHGGVQSGSSNTNPF